MLDSVQRSRHRDRTPETVSSRIAAIDGLRALAVSLVIAFHFGAPLSGGFLGVDLFFVISGFVITRLLLTELRTSGSVNIPTFIGRRIRRLLPALLVVLVSTEIWLQLFGSSALRRAGDQQIAAAALYVSNWATIFAKVQYWDIHSALTPFNHLWSLAVEEQFYLLWPALLWVMVRWLPRRALLPVCATACAASYVLAFILAQTNTTRAYEGTDSRSGALLLGAILAVWLGDRSRRSPSLAAGSRVSMIIGVIALVASAVLWTTLDITAPSLYQYGLVASAVTGAVLIWSLTRHNILSSILGAAPIRYLGRLSYSLYLWHWPVWVAIQATPTIPAQLAAPFGIAITSALAVATYHLIEQPAHRSRNRIVLVALPVALLALGTFAFLITPAAPNFPIPQ